MKCNDAQKLVLLQNAGELSGRNLARLTQHLDACGECRKFQQILCSVMENRIADAEPSIKAVQNVLRTARINAPVSKHHSVFGLKPILGMASAAIIAVGLFFTYSTPNKVGMVYEVTETQLLEPEDQVLSVMYDSLSEDDLAFNFLMTHEES